MVPATFGGNCASACIDVGPKEYAYLLRLIRSSSRCPSFFPSLRLLSLVHTGLFRRNRLPDRSTRALSKLPQMVDITFHVFEVIGVGVLRLPKLFHDLIRVFHRRLSNISSGVAITGALMPISTSAISIFRRGNAPAICLKFQLAMNCTPCKAAMAMCTASV